MSAIFFFSHEVNGQVSGSSFGDPYGTQHSVSLLQGNGHMILRVALDGHP